MEKLKNSEIRKTNLEQVKGGCGRYSCTSVGSSQDQFGFICECGNRELNFLEETADGINLMTCSNCGQLYCNS